LRKRDKKKTRAEIQNSSQFPELTLVLERDNPMGDVSLNPQPLINDEPLTLPATAAKVIDQAFLLY
jgi:hypothetical protein